MLGCGRRALAASENIFELVALPSAAELCALDPAGLVYALVICTEYRSIYRDTIVDVVDA